MGNYSPHSPGLVKCRYKVSVPGHYWVTTALRVVSEIRGPEIRCFTSTIACVILPGLCAWKYLTGLCLVLNNFNSHLGYVELCGHNVVILSVGGIWREASFLVIANNSNYSYSDVRGN